MIGIDPHEPIHAAVTIGSGKTVIDAVRGALKRPCWGGFVRWLWGRGYGSMVVPSGLVVVQVPSGHRRMV